MSAILIRCKLIRAGGTKISMADHTQYHFKDDGTGAHVAVVVNEDHQSRLLSIPEAYCFHGVFQSDLNSAQALGADLIPAKAAVVAEAAVAAAGPVAATVAAAELLNTTAITLPEDSKAPVKVAAEPEKQDAPEDKPENKPEEQTPANELEALSLDELRALYQTETGKAPSATKKPALMISQITALRTERAKAKA